LKNSRSAEMSFLRRDGRDQPPPPCFQRARPRRGHVDDLASWSARTTMMPRRGTVLDEAVLLQHRDRLRGSAVRLDAEALGQRALVQHDGLGVR